MFTSRAEYRLLLREDNADLRLTEIGRQLGLVDDERWQKLEQKREAIISTQEHLQNTWVDQETLPASTVAAVLGKPITREYSLMQLLRRPEIRYQQLMQMFGVEESDISVEVIQQVEIQAKYSGYIDRQAEEIERNRNHEDTVLPETLDYASVRGLSSEMVQKFSELRPRNLGQASRIPGVTPAAISLLRIYLKKNSADFKKSA